MLAVGVPEGTISSAKGCPAVIEGTFVKSEHVKADAPEMAQVLLDAEPFIQSVNVQDLPVPGAVTISIASLSSVPLVGMIPSASVLVVSRGHPPETVLPHIGAIYFVVVVLNDSRDLATITWFVAHDNWEISKKLIVQITFSIKIPYKLFKKGLCVRQIVDFGNFIL